LLEISLPKEAMMKEEACPHGESAAEFLPARITLPQLRAAAAGCRGCDLYCHATQTVFGEGPTGAAVMLVGEQPGDKEDLAGKPFVGPSGQLLDEALEDAAIPRDEVYIINAVKHFKFVPRGTRRIHAKPMMREIKACRPGLEAEIAAVKPRMIVCLGATAAQSLMGSQFRLTQHRGEALETEWAPWLLATNHPAATLRIPDEEMRARSRRQFFDDLKIVAAKLNEELKVGVAKR
jgi:uracil-DNA glycosylase